MYGTTVELRKAEGIEHAESSAHEIFPFNIAHSACERILSAQRTSIFYLRNESERTEHLQLIGFFRSRLYRSSKFDCSGNCNWSLRLYYLALMQLALPVAVAFARVARADYPRHWPSLFQDLISLLNSHDALTTRRTFLVLHHILKELASMRLPADRRNFTEVGTIQRSRKTTAQDAPTKTGIITTRKVIESLMVPRSFQL
jgi:hypothetical protein